MDDTVLNKISIQKLSRRISHLSAYAFGETFAPPVLERAMQEFVEGVTKKLEGRDALAENAYVQICDETINDMLARKVLVASAPESKRPHTLATEADFRSIVLEERAPFFSAVAQDQREKAAVKSR